MKNKLRRTDQQLSLENFFVDSLDDLFDIARANAMETMKIQEDKDFLAKQREKGRPGAMVGVDKILQAREKKKAERRALEKERREKHCVHENG